jgi:squalene cyclase
LMPRAGPVHIAPHWCWTRYARSPPPYAVRDDSDTSRPFPKPTSGCIAVKIINHLDDEVMKILKV